MCCIIIPIYKNKLTEYEIISLRQCCKILGNYPIIFVTYKNLDCTVYNNICTEYGIKVNYEYFDKKYFIDILGYNALLLSNNFYTRFNNYEYMLIYQLDAYVFRNELEYWCNKGYDYIGAPWLKIYHRQETKPKFLEPFAVGNGGFSLRKTKTFIKYCCTKTKIMRFMHLFQSYYTGLSKKSRKNILCFVLRFFLRPILIIFKLIFVYDSEENNNEDKIWSYILHKNGNIPPAIDAMKFAFESFPEYLFEINNNELPFGCHDWTSYYKYLFFKDHILLS